MKNPIGLRRTGGLGETGCTAKAPTHDELAEQASAAMHRLSIHVHYRACEKDKGRKKPK